MRSRIGLGVVAVALAGWLTAHTAEPVGAAPPPAAKPAKAAPAKAAKPDPAFAPITDEPGLPRVLLIGDSISVGYTLPTRERLKGQANVHRIPVNGGPTSTGVAKLSAWLGTGKWDVIHFNWGLHDLKRMENGEPQVPIETYETNLRQLVAELRRTNAKLIWASTTPVPEGTLNPPRLPADVVAYNAAAAKVMAENGVAVDDLYAVALPRLAELQLPVNVHFKPAGSAVLAEAVAASIRAALAAK